MRVYVRTSRSTGVSLGGFAVVMLSPVIAFGWMCWACWMIVKWEALILWYLGRGLWLLGRAAAGGSLTAVRSWRAGTPQDALRAALASVRGIRGGHRAPVTRAAWPSKGSYTPR